MKYCGLALIILLSFQATECRYTGENDVEDEDSIASKNVDLPPWLRFAHLIDKRLRRSEELVAHLQEALEKNLKHLNKIYQFIVSVESQKSCEENPSKTDGETEKKKPVVFPPKDINSGFPSSNKEPEVLKAGIENDFVHRKNESEMLKSEKEDKSMKRAENEVNIQTVASPFPGNIIIPGIAKDYFSAAKEADSETPKKINDQFGKSIEDDDEDGERQDSSSFDTGIHLIRKEIESFLADMRKKRQEASIGN